MFWLFFSTLDHSYTFIRIYFFSEAPTKLVALSIYFESFNFNLQNPYLSPQGKKRLLQPINTSIFRQQNQSNILSIYFSSLANLIPVGNYLCNEYASVTSSLFHPFIILNSNLLWGFANFCFNDVFALKEFRYNEMYYVQYLSNILSPVKDKLLKWNIFTLIVMKVTHGL